MDIARVSKLTGLPGSALRYYEERGLIKSIGRHGLRRVYDDKVVDRLALITLGSKAGFSLDEMQKMFSTKGLTITRALVQRKADELDKKIRELTAMRDGLRHAAECSAPSHFECPKFLRLLRIAGKSRRRQRDGSVLKASKRKGD